MPRSGCHDILLSFLAIKFCFGPAGVPSMPGTCWCIEGVGIVLCLCFISGGLSATSKLKSWYLELGREINTGGVVKKNRNETCFGSQTKCTGSPFLSFLNLV